MARVLLVDDDPNFAQATRSLLGEEGHRIDTARTFADADSELRSRHYDVVLIDLGLPDGSGLDLVRANGPKAVIITGNPSIESAARAVRGPVFDYLIKPVDGEQLREVLRSATANGAAGRPAVAKQRGFSIIGESEPIVALREMIAEYGPTDAPVLVEGESGTGKELVARALHDARSPDSPFVALNCGAIPKELIASELFGHEKGSFTGASGRREGAFERAADGTVFLDEVGELPLDHQVTLLRVLESRSVQRVGGSRDIPIKARVLAATNKDLADQVRDGQFRADLYYRLAVLPIQVPPLRERRDDIPLLAHHFLEGYAGEYGTPADISTELLQEMQAYGWPGNVRELKHTLLRAALASRDRERVERLPGGLDNPLPRAQEAAALQPGTSIRDAEKLLIRRTLRHYGGKRQPTAEALGISLKTLYNRLKEYDMEEQQKQGEP